MKKEYLSAESEPTNNDTEFEIDPAEQRAERPDAKQDEIASIRDSVFNEPAITLQKDEIYLGEWIEKKRAECSLAGNLGVAILAAMLGGPFAILGAFMASQHGWYGLIYIIIFAPIIEEILKQSGMIYLLEKKPYRVFAPWQFVFSAVFAALVFAAIENSLYIHLYSSPASIVDMETFTRFRWIVCTGIHLLCSVIASFGMIRVWKKQLKDGKAADLSSAFKYFAVAITIHGAYNLLATFLDDFFIK